MGGGLARAGQGGGREGGHGFLHQGEHSHLSAEAKADADVAHEAGAGLRFALDVEECRASAHLCEQLELLRRCAARVDVWVALLGASAIGSLQLFGRGASPYSKHQVALSREAVCHGDARHPDEGPLAGGLQ